MAFGAGKVNGFSCWPVPGLPGDTPGVPKTCGEVGACGDEAGGMFTLGSGIG